MWRSSSKNPEAKTHVSSMATFWRGGTSTLQCLTHVYREKLAQQPTVLISICRRWVVGVEGGHVEEECWRREDKERRCVKKTAGQVDEVCETTAGQVEEVCEKTAGQRDEVCEKTPGQVVEICDMTTGHAEEVF